MRRSQAYTLIELLVVLAIIVILAALLLPAVSRARDQSAKAADMSNLHQVMVGLHLYTGDSRDICPWPNWDYGGSMPDGSARAGWLYTPDLSASGTNIFNGQAGLLRDAVRGGKIFLCPRDQPDLARYSKRDRKTEQRDQQLSSYIMNGALIGFRSGYYDEVIPVKISQLQAGDCILWEGDEREPFNFNDGSSWPYEGISARHGNGSMLALADGSSCYVRWTDWQNEVTDTNKNRWWCYPNTANGGDPVYTHVR